MKLLDKIFISLIFINGIWSCSPINSSSIGRERISMPDKFNNTAADKSIAPINWRNYFDDRHLIELIDTALANNLDLKITYQKIIAAQAGVKYSQSKLSPVVDLNFTNGIRKYGLYTMDGAGNSTTDIVKGKRVPEHLPDILIGLQASWEMDIAGKLSNNKKAAIANLLATTEGKNYVVTNLVAAVAMMYYELITLENELEVIQKTIKTQEEALEVINIQKEAGRATELAIQQFKAQILNSKALETDIFQKIVETENNLHQLLGKYPQAFSRNKASLFSPIHPNLAIGLPSDLLQNRPDIKSAEYQLQASNFDVKSAKAAFYPSLHLTAGLGFQAFNPSYLFNTPASIAYNSLAGLTAPLINKNAIKANFSLAQSNQLTALYNYQKAILNSYVEVINELSNINNLQKISSFKKEQSQLSTKSVETSTELYVYARATYLEVLLAQQNALQTNLELINTNKLQKIAAIKLYKALGGGWQ